METSKTMVMDEKTIAHKRDIFLRIYANLPLGARQEVIAVLDPEGPVSWEAAYLEIKNKTAKGDVILQKLTDTKII
jgi:hypothetical protein